MEGSMLSVRVLEGKNLDSTNKIDAFILVKLDKTEYQTIIAHGSNPKWEQ